MIAFQLILLLAIAFIFTLYFFLWRKTFLDKLFLILVPTIGIIFVIKPDWLTRVANFFGIGRGTDLLIYIGILFFMFTTILLFAKVGEINKKITKIIRETAIENAKHNKQEKKYFL
jgi:hypothetical protein